MNKLVLSILMIVFCSASIAQEPSDTNTPKKRQGQGAVSASRESTVMSMMGWGIGLFAGIATLFALLDNNPEEGSGSQAH